MNARHPKLSMHFQFKFEIKSFDLTYPINYSEAKRDACWKDLGQGWCCLILATSIIVAHHNSTIGITLNTTNDSQWHPMKWIKHGLVQVGWQGVSLILSTKLYILRSESQYLWGLVWCYFSIYQFFFLTWSLSLFRYWWHGFK